LISQFVDGKITVDRVTKRTQHLVKPSAVGDGRRVTDVTTRRADFPDILTRQDIRVIEEFRQAESSGAPVACPDVEAFTLRTENAQELHRLRVGVAEPVREVGVEFGDLARGEDEVLIAEYQP
jgi:hypothetical protein